MERTPRPARKRLLILPCLFLLLTRDGLAQESREYQIKAAFLYNFLNFIEWPSSEIRNATGPLIVGVLGENPFNGALEGAVRGKQVRGRGIEVKYFPSIEAVDACDLLFIPSSQGRSVAERLQTSHPQVRILVGNERKTLEEGCHIAFALKGNKVKFAVNLKAAEKADLKISSKMLKIAEEVIQ